MKRRILRYSLLICLLLSAAFVAWTWLRPYDFRPDPAAQCQILETLVTRDQSFFWVNVHLRVNPGMSHDLRIPVVLDTVIGPEQPADTTFAGTDPLNPEEIWLKFWLDSTDLAGPLVLRINGGTLTVKTLPDVPDLGSAGFRNFTTHHW